MSEPGDQSTDRLLWIAAGVVAAMGLAWLVVEAPWSSADSEVFADLASPTPAAITPARVATADEPQPPRPANPTADSLRMAAMALEAGMLIEPADYSAWDLFGRVANADPGNAVARDGLERVAAALLQRGYTAIEQGRIDDVNTIVATINARLPEHRGAGELALAAAVATAPPAPVAAIAAPPPTRRAAPPVDRIPELNQAFADAMAANAVLRPEGTSAIDIVKQMITLNAEHELAVAARELLVTEMLDRSVQSIEALDMQAAQTWIDSAALIADNAVRIELAQERLNDRLIEMQSQRVLPATELTIVRTVQPEFPRIPLQRGIEGWVEIEFVVSTGGETEDLRIVDASHDRYFRDEAIAAVSAWRFEPVMYLGQAIPQRSVTRLEFVLD